MSLESNLSREQALIIAAATKVAIEMQTNILASIKISGKVQQTVNMKDRFKEIYRVLEGAMQEIDQQK
jgi:F0F1-type ATP synthase beta subunit